MPTTCSTLRIPGTDRNSLHMGPVDAHVGGAPCIFIHFGLQLSEVKRYS
jgi:hypothetical protein